MEKEKSFEEMIEDLENIAKDLESGKLSLDASMQKFEEGMQLSKQCSAILENAEKKITMLVQDKQGNMEEKNFNIE